MHNITHIYIDFHGVLTDGKINMSADGKTSFETMHHRDTAALRELVARGFEVTVLTASSNPIIDMYCEKVGCRKITERDKSKLPEVAYIAVGDSSFDIPMFTKAVQKYCPADAAQAVREYPGMNVLQTAGGKGCIAELVEKIFHI